MRIFLLSFLGSFFGIITIFIVLNLFKKFRNLIFSDKALDYKVFENHRCRKLKIIPDTKIETYKIELDKIIDGFIRKSRKTSDYSENKRLQKLCVDLFHLKAILTVEEKEEIVRDIILNEDSKYDVDNEMPYFIKLVNKYIDRIDEYRKEQLEKDFNKIKNEQLN